MTFSFKKNSLILKISMIFLIKEFKYFGNQIKIIYLFIHSFIYYGLSLYWFINKKSSQFLLFSPVQFYPAFLSQVNSCDELIDDLAQD